MSAIIIKSHTRIPRKEKFENKSSEEQEKIVKKEHYKRNVIIIALIIPLLAGCFYYLFLSFISRPFKIKIVSVDSRTGFLNGASFDTANRALVNTGEIELEFQVSAKANYTDKPDGIRRPLDHVFIKFVDLDQKILNTSFVKLQYAPGAEEWTGTATVKLKARKDCTMLDSHAWVVQTDKDRKNDGFQVPATIE